MTTERPYQNLSIGDMAARARDGWLWAPCPIPCRRSIALPISYFYDRSDAGVPAEMILAALRCTSCGDHPTTFTMPSYAGSPTDPHRLAPIPWDKVPAAIREAMGITCPSGQPTCPTDDPTSEAGKPQDGQYGFASNTRVNQRPRLGPSFLPALKTKKAPATTAEAFPSR